MADPLSLLRQYTIDCKQVIERYNNIIFGEHSFPKTVKTNYVIYGTTKEFYTLECLLYFIKKRNLQHPKYVTQADKDGVPFIRRPDRKDLLLYLRGKTNCSPSIVNQEKRTGDDSLEIIKQEKRTGDDTLGIVQQKRTGDDTLEIVKQEKRTGEDTLEIVKQEKRTGDDTLEIVKQEKRTGDDTLGIVKQEKRTGDDTLEIVKQEKRTGDDTLEIVKQEKRTGDDTLEKVSPKKPRIDDATLQTLNDLLSENCCQEYEENSTATAVKEESTTN